jgi:predicted Zn-ribbon and HTH transcriptional regulator
MLRRTDACRRVVAGSAVLETCVKLSSSFDRVIRRCFVEERQCKKCGCEFNGETVDCVFISVCAGQVRLVVSPWTAAFWQERAMLY